MNDLKAMLMKIVGHRIMLSIVLFTAVTAVSPLETEVVRLII